MKEYEQYHYYVSVSAFEHGLNENLENVESESVQDDPSDGDGW